MACWLNSLPSCAPAYDIPSDHWPAFMAYFEHMEMTLKYKIIKISFKLFITMKIFKEKIYNNHWRINKLFEPTCSYFTNNCWTPWQQGQQYQKISSTQVFPNVSIICSTHIMWVLQTKLLAHSLNFLFESFWLPIRHEPFLTLQKVKNQLQKSC